MNKGVGATTLGAVVMTALFFQAKPGSSPSASREKSFLSQQASKPVTGDGPWQASCKYWSEVRPASVSANDAPTNSESMPTAEEKAVALNRTPSRSPSAACGGGDGWGIPERSNGPRAEISAIVATIPDPIHSHLALDFDRAVDAMLLAAADNGYLSSYYWLPWRSHAASLTAGESVADASPKDDDNSRERQPGLIILRYAPGSSDGIQRTADKNSERLSFTDSAYYRVVYIFLVGETPALGVNGDQLKNAFRYEKLLRENYGASLSVRHEGAEAEGDGASRQLSSSAGPATSSYAGDSDGTKLSVIGPFFSGSAASLHQGIEAAVQDFKTGSAPVKATPDISGMTSTLVAVKELDPDSKSIYRSFGENAAFEQERFLQSLSCTGYDLSRVAVLSEAGTVFGAATKFKEGTNSAGAKNPCVGVYRNSEAHASNQGTILNLRFPRELSLLRNAQSNQAGAPDPSNPPTPYLNLSLKDYSADDTVPRFSSGQSPLSIEAQMMAIAHQLQRSRIQFILISASNILDEIFLAQFLHRACPDARLIFFTGGDLLFEREVDNQPYIGSISISSYLLTTVDFGNQVQWLHSDYQAEAVYNAASFTFWNASVDLVPKLGGYRRYPVPDPDPNSKLPRPDTQHMQIPLWAAAIGTDGYYPLAILDWCGSNQGAMLPTISRDASGHPVTTKCDEQQVSTMPGLDDTLSVQQAWDYVPESINSNSGISPSLIWMVLDAVILAMCVFHTVVFFGAQFWSPLTRDLAIGQNDQPHRRAIYLNIGTSVLVAMAFVTAYPLILVGQYYHLARPSYLFAWITLIAALAACITTAIKTWHYRFNAHRVEYGFFNAVAVIALLITVIFWSILCRSDNLNGTHHSYVGLYFSYRCLQPLSGVCPLLPILLLLFAWYLWSMCQTARLRFSEIHRPRLARRTALSALDSYSASDAPYPLYVPDDALEKHDLPIDSCLYDNITCLLITREVIQRFCSQLRHDPRKLLSRSAIWLDSKISPVLAVVYLALFALCIFTSHIHSLDSFLFNTHHGPTLYEILIGALFFPLIMVALSGWFRTILIWGGLRRGLLEPLERMPIRFAFTRFTGVSWMSMLNQSGLHIRWLDMSRATESIRQLVHHPDVQSDSILSASLTRPYEAINLEIQPLVARIHTIAKPAANAEVKSASNSPTPLELIAERAGNPPLKYGWDCPRSSTAAADLCSVYKIESRYAEFCRVLLDSVLIHHWDKLKTGLVEETNTPLHETVKVTGGAEMVEAGNAEPPKTPAQVGTAFITLAEELIVIRYIALIRSVLVNMRYLMLFVSASFVLSIVAWNSYPFQPHQFIDWCFTILLVVIGFGFITIFAQMHRNPLLSRITDTTPNKLGIDFYIRIATFGAVPVLTWLAYQFPDVGGSLFRILQPSLQVMK